MGLKSKFLSGEELPIARWPRPPSGLSLANILSCTRQAITTLKTEGVRNSIGQLDKALKEVDKIEHLKGDEALYIEDWAMQALELGVNSIYIATFGKWTHLPNGGTYTSTRALLSRSSKNLPCCS